MITNLGSFGNKDLGSEIIYKDRAKTLGILDKIEKDPRFELRRVTFDTGEQIEYYKFIANKTEDYMVPVIKQFIKESKENILFTYDPKDFENATDAMKRYIKDNKKEGYEAYEISEAIPFRLDPPAWNSFTDEMTKSAKLQQDLLNEIEARINDK